MHRALDSDLSRAGSGDIFRALELQYLWVTTFRPPDHLPIFPDSSDMVLLSEGITAHWMFTAKSTGTVLKRKCADLHPQKIKSSWMCAAKRNPKNFERHVAMVYDGEVPTDE